MMMATNPTEKHETLFLLLCDLVVFVANNTRYGKLSFLFD